MIDIDDGACEHILDHIQRLPRHPEVPDALARLRDAGHRQVALTNSPLATARAQLANAGVAELFEQTLSADEVQQLKPGPRPYHLVADRTGVPIDQVMLIAAHAWDVSGALAAGARAGFVARPGMVLSPIGEQPEVVVDDLTGLADRLLDGQ